MRKVRFIGLTLLFLGAVGHAADDGPVVHLRATLLGANEVPPISTTATAEFSATILQDGSIPFTLTFDGLAANAAVSHIHFAPTKVAGGVMIFLCGGGNQPACPAATSGTVEGTITAANVTGPSAQGITAGDLISALEAVRDGLSYANMHTTNFPGGEIRGNVSRGAGHGNDGD